MDNRRILVVDDEPFILRSLTYVLRREGFETVGAANGEEAIKQISKAKPRLMFLDLMMPKMTGFEVCRRIREHPEWKDIYIILLTARGENSDRLRAFESGADEYMTKPFSPSKVVQRVREVLATKEEES
jgi:two-component system phosphate regulon response regulator PhoB